MARAPTHTLTHIGCEFVSADTNNKQTEIAYKHRDSLLLLRCFVCSMYIVDARALTHSLTFDHSTYSSLRLNYYWARAHTHTYTHEKIFTLFIGIGAMLIVCVGTYIVCCLAHHTSAIAASPSHQRGVYHASDMPTSMYNISQHNLAIFPITILLRTHSFWGFICASVSQAAPDRVHRLFSTPKSKYECKTPRRTAVRLDILIFSLLFS